MMMSVSHFGRWPTIAPWSWRGFAAALLLVATSYVLQTLAEFLGVHLEFAAFFPAVFFAGFLAGKPAGGFAAILTLPLVWWAFLPPAFELSPLTADGYDEIKLFLLGSVLLVYGSDLCRDIYSFPRHGREQASYSSRDRHEPRHSTDVHRAPYDAGATSSRKTE
jgi:hypothetical protein